MAICKQEHTSPPHQKKKTIRELLTLSEESDPKYMLGVEQNEVSWWGGSGGGGGDAISNSVFKQH